MFKLRLAMTFFGNDHLSRWCLYCANLKFLHTGYHVCWWYLTISILLSGNNVHHHHTGNDGHRQECDQAIFIQAIIFTDNKRSGNPYTAVTFTGDSTIKIWIGDIRRRISKMNEEMHDGTRISMTKHNGARIDLRKHDGTRIDMTKHYGMWMNMRKHNGTRISMTKQNGTRIDKKKHYGTRINMRKHSCSLNKFIHRKPINLSYK